MVAPSFSGEGKASTDRLGWKARREEQAELMLLVTSIVWMRSKEDMSYKQTSEESPTTSRDRLSATDRTADEKARSRTTSCLAVLKSRRDLAEKEGSSPDPTRATKDVLKERNTCDLTLLS